MKKGYEVTYEWVIKLLQDCDFDESSKRLGLKQVSQNNILINFLERTYIIAKDRIGLTEQKIDWTPKTEGYDYNLKSVLGYYLLSEANLEPGNDFCLLTHFSGGVFGNGSPWPDSLGKVYGNDYKKFCRIAEKLGMVFETEKRAGQYVWSYTLLPKIPIKIMYYEGDDEYPTTLQILYDKTAIQFYKFEPLAVLHFCFIEGLAAIGEQE
ncbi:MAG: DUF3786 domain-containing protein [Treponema sp.]|jgi:hypothetical protein|nr:DUF3786 domain-containing protein [Treponema sp.]